MASNRQDKGEDDKSGEIVYGKKEDVKPGDIKINWSSYVEGEPDEVIQDIYKHAKDYSSNARSWYWNSIESKRRSSWIIRVLSFSLLVLGVALPLLSALAKDDAITLSLTQFGVVAIAVAGLLQGADKIFGWSSGWIRYINTVMEMEATTRQFELEWANYMIDKKGKSLESEDKDPLFKLAKGMEDEISNLQSEETKKWSAEFSNSLDLLNDLIKSQRESIEQARSNAEGRIKAQQRGGIEMKIVHTSVTRPIKISVDDANGIEFEGSVWSTLGLSPGLHKIQVTTRDTKKQNIQKIVEVPSGGIAQIEISLQ